MMACPEPSDLDISVVDFVARLRRDNLLDAFLEVIHLLAKHSSCRITLYHLRHRIYGNGMFSFTKGCGVVVSDRGLGYRMQVSRVRSQRRL
jgi:hypothetical protein